MQSQLTTPFPTRIPKPCGIITAVEYFQTCRIRTLFEIIYRYLFFFFFLGEEKETNRYYFSRRN